MYPLEAMRIQLKILRFMGGLPLEPRRNETTKELHRSKIGLVCLGGAVGLFLTAAILTLVILFASGGSMFDRDIFLENGVLYTDAVVIFSTYYMNMAAMAFVIWGFYWHGNKKLSAVLEAIGELPREQVAHNDVKRIARRNTVKVVLMYVCALLSTLFISVWGLIMWIPEERPLWLKAVFVLCINVNGVQCYFSPVVMAAHLIKYQLFGYVALQQQAYNKRLVEHCTLHNGPAKSSAKKSVEIATVTEDVQDMAADIGLGFKIQRAVKALDDAYGHFSFIEIINDLYTATSGIFLVSILFVSSTYDQDGSPKYAPLGIGLSNICLAIHALTRYYNVLRCGQSIASANGNIKEALADIVRVRRRDFSETTRADAKALIHKCSAPCPIRPLDIFDQNYSTGFSALGLCLTYIIVLVQFKISE